MSTPAISAKASMPERELRELWDAALGGCTGSDNFFLAGGNSITASMLIARVNRTFGAAVRLGDFLRSPRFGDLTQLIRARVVAPAADGPLANGRPSHKQLFRLDSMYRYEWLPRTHGLVTMWLEHDGPVEPDRLQAALQALVDRHDVLRSRFRLVDGEWQVSVAPTATLSLTTHIDDAWSTTPFPLDGGCWLRAALLDGPERTRIAVMTDHLVWDGFSAAVIRDELWSAYADGATSIVMPYYTWAAREHASATGPRAVELTNAWRRMLAEATLSPPFPFDGDGEDGDRYVRVDLGDHEAVTHRAATIGVTTAGYALTLWFSALLDVADHLDRTVVHLPVANRDDRTAHSIGWFANVMAVPYTRADHRLPPAGRARAVSERVIFALEHCDLPLRTVVPELVPQSWARPPGVFANIDIDGRPAESDRFRLVQDDPPLRTISDIHLEVSVRAGRIVADIAADPRLVTRSQLAAVAGRLAELATQDEEGWKPTVLGRA